MNKYFIAAGVVDFLFGLLPALFGFTLATNPESLMFPQNPYNQAIGITLLIIGIIVMISSIGVIMQKKIAMIVITIVFVILLVLYLIQGTLVGKIGIENIAIYGLIISGNYGLIKKAS